MAPEAADQTAVAESGNDAGDKNSGSAGTTEPATDNVPLGVVASAAEEVIDDGLLHPVRWEIKAQKNSASEYELVFKAIMDKSWTIYSQHVEEGGPEPTYFGFDEGDHYSRLGEVSESGKKKEGIDPIFEVYVTKFLDEPVEFRQKLSISDPEQRHQWVCDVHDL